MNVVFGEMSVVGDYGELVEDSLCNNETVEGIIVMMGQMPNGQDFGKRDGEEFDAEVLQLGREDDFGRCVEFEFSEAVFDGDFPDACEAQEQIVLGVFNDCSL